MEIDVLKKSTTKPGIPNRDLSKMLVSVRSVQLVHTKHTLLCARHLG
jgi:hypothetical protein